jgi:hypothetical protein
VIGRAAFRLSVSLVAVGMLGNLVAFVYQAGRDAGEEAGWNARERAAVCWAATEDSELVGCDFRAGAWWVDR